MVGCWAVKVAKDLFKQPPLDRFDQVGPKPTVVVVDPLDAYFACCHCGSLLVSGSVLPIGANSTWRRRSVTSQERVGASHVFANPTGVSRGA